MSISYRSARLFVALAILSLVLVTLFPVLGSTQSGETGKDRGIKVTVLLFSGRPDPSFIMEDEDMLNRVKRLVGTAKEDMQFKKETVIPAILGYKGIVVDNMAGISGIPSRLAVYKGTIEVKNERMKFLKDEGGALEDFLMKQAIKEGVIDEKILKRMQ